MDTGTACDIVIRADVDRVWALVTDIELPTRFSPELRRVRWLDGATGPALGARFEGHNSNPALGEWRSESHVVELVPQRVFAWEVIDTDGRFGNTDVDPVRPIATWRYELEPSDAGVLLRHAVRLGPARSGLTLAIEVKPDKTESIVQGRLADLRAAMETALRGVKDAAEDCSRRADTDP